MKRLQFSILTLLGAVALTGLGCAALVNASGLWAAGVVSVTVLALLTATVGAVYSQSRSGAFCGGFAIFGWPYLLFATSSLFNDVEQYFFTGAANDALYAVLVERGANVAAPAPPQPWSPTPVQRIMTTQTAPAPGTLAPATAVSVVYAAPYAYAPSVVNSIPYPAFDRIGHALWAILLGVVGGVVAMWFAGRAKPGNSAAQSEGAKRGGA